MTLRAVGGLLVSYLIVLGLLAFMQDKLLLYPPASGVEPGTAQAVGTPLPDGQGWVREADAGPAKATMLLFHGNAGCAFHHGALADALAQRGWRIVSVEFPGYCGRAGTASVDAILKDASWQLGQVRGRYPGPVAVGGYSLGAAIAASVAREPDVSGLLLITPWASFRALAQHHYPYLPVRLVVRRDLETVDTLADAAQRGLRIAMLAAAHDEIIPVAHARELAERFPAARYVELPEAGHNDWVDFTKAEHWDALDAALSAPRTQR